MFHYKNKLYLKIQNNALKYAVLSPTNKLVEDTIELTELGCEQDIFYANQHTVQNNYLLLLKLKAKLPEILKITSDRGHTRFRNYNNTSSFPQIENVQRVFGMDKELLYQYIDKFHPTPYLRVGFEMEPYEYIADWWNKHEKNASKFSTELTENLIKVIQTTMDEDVESLKTLFAASDRWLILKENSSTSRYYQVQALRNNIFHRLTKEMDVDKYELIAISHALMKEEKYFLSHWNKASAAASFFCSEETEILDQAFAAHSQDEISNEELLAALEEWLMRKQTSNSARYDLVFHMRDQLREFIRVDFICRTLGSESNDANLSYHL